MIKHLFSFIVIKRFINVVCVTLYLHNLQMRNKQKMQQGKEQNQVYDAHRILILDGDDSVRQSLNSVLELKGYRTADAGTAD